MDKIRIKIASVFKKDFSLGNIKIFLLKKKMLLINKTFKNKLVVHQLTSIYNLVTDVLVEKVNKKPNYIKKYL